MTSEEEVRRVADGVADRVREAVTRELHAAFAGAGSSLGKSAARGLLASIRLIDEARSLSGVLDAIATGDGSETGRTAVFLVAAGGLRLWKRSGSGWPEGSGGADGPPAGLTVPSDDVAEIGDLGNEFAAPIRVGGQVVAVLYSACDEASKAGAGAQTARLELLARHAGRSLEAVTALRSAQLFAASPEASRAKRGIGVEDFEAARRYARLLVSEIKLYHEPAVAAGIKDRDLASRLSGEIARARALYHERVSPRLAHGDRLFHDELVRTLANGDASLLGELRADS